MAVADSRLQKKAIIIHMAHLESLVGAASSSILVSCFHVGMDLVPVEAGKL
jgi:hypothetical protein